MRAHILLAVAAVSLHAGPALAHVTVDPAEAPANSYRKLVFRVPHGCAGKPTTGLTLDLPENLATAKPQPKPGWTLETQKAPVVATRDAHGHHGQHGQHGHGPRERVTSISWSGGNLPNDQFDEFSILVRVPEAGVLTFSAVQTCGEAERRWSGPEGSDSPAPTLRIVPGR